ncbi:PREDICTED: putative nuclease HARBI1 [Rhagoletis zephyria]|uniref:putative nuclease HARBI1 n=1 Tax=Rhagoletis zephyria TaxID=28612 RepID=UPI0008119397|nr:PREDICTED: putative nuclease HARBI1 [Rhagoletis zephyria]
MIICDYQMMTKAVDARRPGSCHDSLIWRVSKSHTYFSQSYENGERGDRLLGDADYPLQPYLLTPYRDPQPGTVQYRFNQRHASARNIIERTIGILKSRFKCLARHNTVTIPAPKSRTPDEGNASNLRDYIANLL